MKEFNCIYELCRLEQNHSLSLVDYIKELIHVLPQGFSKPDQTQFKISLFGILYTSENFSEGKTIIREDIILQQNKVGLIEVHLQYEGQFSDEERKLLSLIKNNIQGKNTSLLSEEKFQIIANNTYNWEFWVGADNQFVFHSPSCERITGYKPNEIAHHDFLTEHIIHPDDRELYRNHRHNACDRREADFLFFKIHTKSGETRVIEHVCKPVFDAQGNFLGVRGTNIDITDKKEIEDSLLKNENKFKILFYESPIPYLIIVDGVFIECNVAAEKIFRGSRADIIGKTPKDISPEYQENNVSSEALAIQYIEECFIYGKKSFDWMHVRKDGSHMLLHIDINVIDYDGKKALLTCWKDITEEKLKSEEVLKFRILAEQANYGIALTDMDGNLNFVNQYLAKMHGYEVEELQGKNLIILHNQQQLEEEVLPLLQVIKTKGGFSAEEVNHARKDGSTFPTLMSSKIIFDDHGAPKFMSATMLDISENKKNEDEIRKLTLAIEQSPVGIIISGLDSKIQYVNPHFTAITGYTQEEALNLHPINFQSGLNDKKVHDDIIDKIRNNKIWHGEIISKRKHGDLYWEQMTVSPILNEKGQPTHFLCIITDISERKKAEEEIKEMNHFLEVKIKERTADLEKSNLEMEHAKQLADEANRAKSDFLSRMSHELRTPMNSILGFAQLLEMGSLDQNQAIGVQHILKSGKLLLDLINEVLDISRIESGRISISMEPVEVCAVVKEVMDITMPLADSKKIKVSFINNLTDLAFIKADRQRLKQVLLNLLNNAIKYNKAFGYVNIEVHKTHSTENNSKVKISVTDNGFGIDQGDLPRIFHPFERLSAENSNIEGTGLGLAVVNQLIGVMHGNIGVESVLHEGSTFWVEFDESLEIHQQKQLHEDFESNNQNQSINQNGTILYIEDNPSNTDLVSQIINLQRPGIKLITSVYGRSTLSLAIQHHPKLILLDLNLPDIHGSEVLMELKNHEHCKDIPVIILSADAMPNQIKNVMKIGAANYLTKPIDIASLLLEIDKYLKP